jgi:endoglucanase
MVQVFGADNTWDESAINFNNAPAINGSALDSATIANTSEKYYYFDVSSYIKAQKVAGATEVTLAVKAPAFSSNFVTFKSREASSNQPLLMIA